VEQLCAAFHLFPEVQVLQKVALANSLGQQLSVTHVTNGELASLEHLAIEIRAIAHRSSALDLVVEAGFGAAELQANDSLLLVIGTVLIARPFTDAGAMG